jgi:hypothetical protein
MTRYWKSEDVVARSVRGERILVPISGKIEDLDSLYTLNETAAAIWDAAEDGSTLDEIVACVLETYEVSVDEARRDVRRVLTELVAAGALETRPG